MEEFERLSLARIRWYKDTMDAQKDAEMAEIKRAKEFSSGRKNPRYLNRHNKR